jgi:uncharacterized protein
MGQNIRINDTIQTGKGLYANVNFKRGNQLGRFADSVVPWSKATHRSVQIGTNQWLTPKSKDYGYYLNHSCEPNCYILNGKIVATARIIKDEEVTIDYSTVVHSMKWDMACRCSSKNCRKIIVPFVQLPKKLKKKYHQFTSFPELL